MSDLILRGLVLDTARTTNTLPSSLRGLVKKSSNDDTHRQQGAVTLSRLDYLITSNNTRKGSAPISLLSPGSLKSDRTNSNSKITKADLLQGLDNVRPSNNNSRTNSTTSVPTSYNFIDTDYTSEKLELAIEAIDNWERKVGSLNSLITNSKGETGIAYKNTVVTSADKLDKARKEAINARQDAIIAYNEALKEIMEIGNTSSSKTNLYRQKYNIMESKFTDVKIKDQNTMDKVKEYLKTGFNYVIDYANPFSY